jgi:hypothetical protein
MLFKIQHFFTALVLEGVDTVTLNAKIVRLSLERLLQIAAVGIVAIRTGLLAGDGSVLNLCLTYLFANGFMARYAELLRLLN